MLQSGWEVSLGKNEYMNMYGWVLLLYTWNYHKIVNWLYFSTKLNVFLKKQNQIEILVKKHNNLNNQKNITREVQ